MSTLEGKSPSGYKTAPLIMFPSSRYVRGFSHVNPTAAPLLSDAICFTQLLFQRVKPGPNLQRLACFTGCPALGCQKGRIGQLLMEGGKADIKYRPDGLSPILLIKSSEDSSQIKASRYYVKRLDCYCYCTFANTNVIYGFSSILPDSSS